MVERAGCFAPVKRLARKIVSEIMLHVSSGTLNRTRLNAGCVSLLSYSVSRSSVGHKT